MLRKISVTGAIVLAAAGTVTMGTASAAPQAKCWVGSWKVTSASVHADDTRKKTRFSVRGGAGIKVKLARNGRMAYDFTGSKPLRGTGAYNGIPAKASISLSRKLTASSKITGSKKGTISVKVGSIRGNAVLKLTTPVPVTLGLASAAKKGASLGVVPIKATYTCAGGTGRIRQSYKKGSLTTVSDWRLRRA
ncbi:MAG: hypothetical protein ABIS86_18670 [Streptosporangiaceae bacterium]